MSESHRPIFRTYGSKPRKVPLTYLWDGTKDIPRRPILGENSNEVNEKRSGSNISGIIQGVVEWLSPRKSQPQAKKLAFGKENQLVQSRRLSLPDEQDDSNVATTTVASNPIKKNVRDKEGVELLLQFCDVDNVVDFSEFITLLLKNAKIEKLGEASYSEVFTLTNPDGTSTVLKIIPFTEDKENQKCSKDSGISNLDDILQEIRISRVMTKVDGFAQFKGYNTQSSF